MENAFTSGNTSLTPRVIEVFKSGRQVWHLVGDEVMRYEAAIKEASKQMTADRMEASKKYGITMRPVVTVSHDRWCGLYSTLPTMKRDEKTSLLARAIEMFLRSKEEWDQSGVSPPFQPEADVIMVCKSVDDEIRKDPFTATLIRNIIQSNMCSPLHFQDLVRAEHPERTPEEVEKSAQHRGARMIVLITSTLNITGVANGINPIPELKPEVVPLPGHGALKAIALDIFEPLWEQFKQTKGQRGMVPIAPERFEKIVQALTGMTMSDAEEATSLAVIRVSSLASKGNKNLDLNDNKLLDHVLDTIEKEKAKAIAKIPGLTYLPKELVVEQIPPGYEKLAKFIDQRMAIPQVALEEYHLKPITGIAIGGSPGTAKTETALYIPRRMGRIGLLWNMGESKGSLVGATEETCRRIIQIARAMAAVVICDDVDKGGLAKAKDYSGDGGTSGNMIQMLLTDMSDPYSPAIYVFNFNRVPDLPELLRPGRMEFLGHVKRPGPATRLAIFREHIFNRWKMQVDHPDALKPLADKLEGWNGAEIAHRLVKPAAIEAMISKSRVIHIKTMEDQAEGFVPHSQIRKFAQDIKEMDEACSQFEPIGLVPEDEEPKSPSTVINTRTPSRRGTALQV